MMIPLETYLRRGQHTVRRWLLEPRVLVYLRAAVYFLSGFGLSAASLIHGALPLAMGLVFACTGWSAVLVAAGSCAGYLLFWGSAG